MQPYQWPKIFQHCLLEIWIIDWTLFQITWLPRVSSTMSSTTARLLFSRSVLPVIRNNRFTIRQFESSGFSARQFSLCKQVQSKPFYTVTYELGNGERHSVQVIIDLHSLPQEFIWLTFQAKEGDNLLDVVINNDVDIDGFGACEGTLACSTCHLIFTQEDFDKIDEEATDEELDMLVIVSQIK